MGAVGHLSDLNMAHVPRTGRYGYMIGICSSRISGIWWSILSSQCQVYGLVNDPDGEKYTHLWYFKSCSVQHL